MLNEREREINRYLKDLENSRVANQRANDEKSSLMNENEKLKNHIVVLTEDNERVI
jgi:hypothetical protein